MLTLFMVLFPPHILAIVMNITILVIILVSAQFRNLFLCDSAVVITRVGV